MATSLRDIPGANRSRNRRQAERGLWAPTRTTTLDLTPGALRLGGSRPPRFARPKRRVDKFLIVLIASAIVVALWLGAAFWRATRVGVEMAGFDNGRSFTPDDAGELDIAITLDSGAELFRANLEVDGTAVTKDLEPEADGVTVLVRPAQLVEDELVEEALAEGEHRIELSVPRPFLGDAKFSWSYVVDSVAPSLELPPSLDPVAIDEPVTVAGKVEPGVELRFRGEPVKTKNGTFAVDFDTPPTGALAFHAVDEAGNATTARVVVPVVYPDSSKGVHVSGAAWGNDELRAGVLDLIDRGLIDTVELDLKDEGGVVSYDSQLRKAREIGAVSADYDLAETVQLLEDKGIRVIGRLVAFRDPIYTRAAWAGGRRNEVIQTRDGEMLTEYGGFANYASPEVQEYNLDIALEAVELGVKDILWDYIRRPEGEPSEMVVPGLEAPSSQIVADFLGESHAALRERGAFQGASVFGIAAAAGDSIAQDIPAMATVVDYLAPMTYPSHWGPGQYRVKSPIDQPYDIVAKSLADFQRVSEGSGVRFVPWIQAFTVFGVEYGPAQVQAQIEAAESLGIDGFLLWNPNVRYDPAALSPLP